LKGFIQQFSKEKAPAANKVAPVVIPRGEHIISRNAINPNALKVLYRLHNAGFTAYLVGGCVRDLLLERQPKDFDIATNALPEEVRKLFRNCCLIGKRFRLAHIIFGKEIIEVATFRAHHKEGSEKEGHSTHRGMIVRDNVYGTIEEDVWRRDFTVNALYYSIADYSILDYMNGMQDLKSKLLKIASKLNLQISPETEACIISLNHLLEHVSPARLYQEVLKFFQEGATLQTFRLLQKYNLFSQLFPQTNACLTHPQTIKLLEEALTNTDSRTNEGKSISPAFLFAIFVWQPVLQKIPEYEAEDLPTYSAFEKAIRVVLRQQTDRLTIPKRLQMSIHDICLLQHRFTMRSGIAPFRLLDHPRFRAAYDLLLLRTHAGEPIQELSTWWTQFYTGNNSQRELLLKEANKSSSRKKRKKFPSRKKKPKPEEPPIT
jgi:poly(A) polymerase